MDSGPPSNKRGLRVAVWILLGIGTALCLCGGLPGATLMIADTLYTRSLPPYPEGPPDAGVYGYLLGMILILSCVPLGLLLTLVGGILELIRRRR